MAVLIECLNVVVRRDAIAARMRGGWTEFVGLVPNQSLCADDHLARVGFMAPSDVGEFLDLLGQAGLVAFDGTTCRDMVVIDAHTGTTRPCTWVDVYATRSYDGGSIIACSPAGWAGGRVSVPVGWAYESSLSRAHSYIPLEHADEEMEFLRHGTDGFDVFWDKRKQREVVVGRTGCEPLVR